MDADLFERWFVIADQDHDGMVSGSEAVEFFQRSNLGQETLFQVLLRSTFLSLPAQRSEPMPATRLLPFVHPCNVVCMHVVNLAVLYVVCQLSIASSQWSKKWMPQMCRRYGAW